MVVLTHPFSRVRCPFCLGRFHPSEALIRPRDGELEGDEALRAFFGKQIAEPQLPRVVPLPQKPFPKWITRTDARDGGRRVCPSCHLPLPISTATGELKPKTIAIVGAKASGKSHWFGVLIRMLYERYSREVGFAVQALDTWDLRAHEIISSTQLYQRRYGEPLFKKKEKIRPTLRAQDDPEIRIPLLYRLRFENRVLDLSIFDAAGEDLGLASNLEQFCRYISIADGIVCVLDPERLPGFRCQLPPARQAQLPAEVGQDQMVSAFLGFFDNYVHHRAARRIGHVPVALAFSKSDLFDDVETGSMLSLLDEPQHRGGFNELDSRQVHREVSALVDMWGGYGDLAALIARFERTRYFAFSALGESPTGDHIDRIRPRRVGDPLLWILTELGYLRPLRWGA